MKTQLRLVRTDDWCALYLDGKSIYQGHSISVEDLFNLLKERNVDCCLNFKSTDAGKIDSHDAEDLGSLPDTLQELKDTKTK